jgi:hypothetical protein
LKRIRIIKGLKIFFRAQKEDGRAQGNKCRRNKHGAIREYVNGEMSGVESLVLLYRRGGSAGDIP